MNKDNGGYAFPHGVEEINYDVYGDLKKSEYTDAGMTLRDYFAAKAMAALMPVYWETQEEYEAPESLLKCQAEAAYEYADAMLEARKK